MPRHLVCLTFDFDTSSGFIARGLTSPSAISRGEFGIVGAGRVLALMKRYDIPTTWFVPGFTAETYPEMTKRVIDAGHEIGHHGWTHMPPASWGNVQDEEADLVRGIETLRTFTGRAPRGYRSPSWDLSPRSLGLLLKHGFVYDSSLMGDDYTPYRARQGDVIELQAPMKFGPTTRLIEMPISWTLDDYPHFEYLRMPTYVQQGLMSAQVVVQNWIDDFTYLADNLDWGVITYTFHPYVIGRGHRMMILERLIKACADRGAVFCTMETAVAEYAKRVPFAA